jgi:hypothetical protein
LKLNVLCVLRIRLRFSVASRPRLHSLIDSLPSPRGRPNPGDSATAQVAAVHQLIEAVIAARVWRAYTGISLVCLLVLLTLMACYRVG